MRKIVFFLQNTPQEDMRGLQRFVPLLRAQEAEWGMTVGSPQVLLTGNRVGSRGGVKDKLSVAHGKSYYGYDFIPMPEETTGEV